VLDFVKPQAARGQRVGLCRESGGDEAGKHGRGNIGPPLLSRIGKPPMPHHAHSIDRWDDATGSNLYRAPRRRERPFYSHRRPSRLRSNAGPVPRSRSATARASLRRPGRPTIGAYIRRIVVPTAARSVRRMHPVPWPGARAIGSGLAMRGGVEARLSRGSARQPGHAMGARTISSQPRLYQHRTRPG
jgi:hypothetical protein